ncbi:MAG: amino-acid N-acetyltransferase [Proteobacteria bacterium]|nr:amino-acid N-acetyltransferase [Pseudomonadota bacterium]
MNRVIDSASFVRWFRDSTPYINAHRGRTFVVHFGGEAVQDPAFHKLAHDLTLLCTLGVRLVVVFGAEPQLRARARAAGLALGEGDRLPVIDEPLLALASEAASAVRLQLEAQLARGLANAPQAGPRLRVVSGNFVAARPLGVRNGVDLALSGEVRRIDADAMTAALGVGAVVLLGPIAYSPTGEIFYLDTPEVAMSAAVALRADKLLYLAEQPGPRDPRDQPLRQLSSAEVEQRLKADDGRALGETTQAVLRLALRACRAGVRRVHLLERQLDGALLQELFTRDGVGTLVSDSYEGMRPATIDDAGGILALIVPLEEQGILVRRSRERLENEIERFVVIERDGGILACAALYPFVSEAVGELACVATHPAYRGEGRGAALLEYLEQRARAAGIERLFVLTTHAAHWFREHGFEPAKVADLPLAKQAMYNYQRNSAVFIKPLG